MMKKGTKTKAIIVGALIVVATVTAIVCGTTGRHNGKESKTKVEVTEEDIAQYREMIGDSMDIKKAIFILFEDEAECKNFISEHGVDKEPHMVGKGIVPLMENGYYNIVGKPIVEEAFDKLKDGEYTKEPIVYSGMYCYLKRIGIESPLEDDNKVKEMILNDKKVVNIEKDSRRRD